jgi:hypothetical protein
MCTSSSNNFKIGEVYMNPEVKNKLVAALRSGEYKQTQGQLREGDDSFCCLGVLCDLHAKETGYVWEEAWSSDYPDGFMYLGQEFILPEEVRTWAGLPSSDGGEVRVDGCRGNLANHNDNGRTFEEIADAIEEQL